MVYFPIIRDFFVRIVFFTYCFRMCVLMFSIVFINLFLIFRNSYILFYFLMFRIDFALFSKCFRNFVAARFLVCILHLWFRSLVCIVFVLFCVCNSKWMFWLDVLHNLLERMVFTHLSYDIVFINPTVRCSIVVPPR